MRYGATSDSPLFPRCAKSLPRSLFFSFFPLPSQPSPSPSLSPFFEDSISARSHTCEKNEESGESGRGIQSSACVPDPHS